MDYLNPIQPSDHPRAPEVARINTWRSSRLQARNLLNRIALAVCTMNICQNNIHDVLYLLSLTKFCYLMLYASRVSCLSVGEAFRSMLKNAG
jgi:hypothetical protein